MRGNALRGDRRGYEGFAAPLHGRLAVILCLNHACCHARILWRFSLARSRRWLALPTPPSTCSTANFSAPAHS